MGRHQQRELAYPPETGRLPHLQPQNHPSDPPQSFDRPTSETQMRTGAPNKDHGEKVANFETFQCSNLVIGAFFNNPRRQKNTSQETEQWERSKGETGKRENEGVCKSCTNGQ